MTAPLKADTRPSRAGLIRKGFVMSVHPGCEQEYERRHNPIWPELESTLKEHGVHHYSIFFDQETHLLFGYIEIESEERLARISQTDVCRRWWQHMHELMPCHENYSPHSRDIAEVFHIE